MPVTAELLSINVGRSTRLAHTVGVSTVAQLLLVLGVIGLGFVNKSSPEVAVPELPLQPTIRMVFVSTRDVDGVVVPNNIGSGPIATPTTLTVTVPALPAAIAMASQPVTPDRELSSSAPPVEHETPRALPAVVFDAGERGVATPAIIDTEAGSVFNKGRLSDRGQVAFSAAVQSFDGGRPAMSVGAGIGHLDNNTSTLAFTGERASSASTFRILTKPRPAYTEEARRHRVEGQVTFVVVFQASGRVRVESLLSGLGFGLDDRAADAVRGITFAPASRNGQPVDLRTTVRVFFRLLTTELEVGDA